MIYFELARRHYVYTFDTSSAVTVVNQTKGIKLRFLGGISIKRKNSTHASIKRAYKQYHRQCYFNTAGNIIDILKEIV